VFCVRGVPTCEESGCWHVILAQPSSLLRQVRYFHNYSRGWRSHFINHNTNTKNLFELESWDAVLGLALLVVDIPATDASGSFLASRAASALPRPSPHLDGHFCHAFHCPLARSPMMCSNRADPLPNHHNFWPLFEARKGGSEYKVHYFECYL